MRVTLQYSLPCSLLPLQNDILGEIIETERQLLLWGKKIQLEKETQAALDPELGKGEVKNMEREVCTDDWWSYRIVMQALVAFVSLHGTSVVPLILSMCTIHVLQS